MTGSPPAGEDVQFRILGPLEAYSGGRALALGGRKQRALLAILLLHANEVLSADRLVDDLWSGEAPESGVAALQVRVSQLRKSLEAAGERLLTRAPGYMFWLEAGELDLERFERLLAEADDADPAQVRERLVEALALWRGAPLADFAYEPFAQAAIGRLEDLRLLAIEKRIDAELALGRHTELVGELQALAREHPLRERARAQLLLALYRSGRQADALAAYQEARRTLVDELGIEPSETLQDLERAILRHDSVLDLAPAGTASRSIVVTAADDRDLDALLLLAKALARDPAREIILACALPPSADIGAAAARLHDRRKDVLRAGVVARAAAFTTPEPGRDLVRLATEQDADLLLVAAAPALLDDETLSVLLASAPCDVAIVRAGEDGGGAVLVPFSGAEHDWSAIELAAWIARSRGATLRIVGSTAGAAGHDSSRLLASASLAVQAALRVVAEPQLVEPGAEQLVRAANGATLVVVGLSERWRQEGLGTVRRALVEAARPPVVLVRRGLRPGGLAPSGSLTRFTWTVKAGR
jgi:DNA-binding SARP family transcriptional activator/methylmalonyl-CoA mutase cobalamin-binding subunit